MIIDIKIISLFKNFKIYHFSKIAIFSNSCFLQIFKFCKIAIFSNSCFLEIFKFWKIAKKMFIHIYTLHVYIYIYIYTPNLTLVGFMQQLQQFLILAQIPYFMMKFTRGTGTKNYLKNRVFAQVAIFSNSCFLQIFKFCKIAIFSNSCFLEIFNLKYKFQISDFQKSC